MSAHDGTVTAGAARLLRPRYLLILAVLAAGALAAVLIAQSRTSAPSRPTGATAPSGPAATWAAGARPAPGFSLVDQQGAPISISRFAGRPVVVTFIDPLCRNLCPLEAQILDRAVARLPAAQRPAIVAVSVDQWGNARRYLLEDLARWHLGSSWHWAVGPVTKLRPVWRAYQIGVLDVPKTVAGVTVHNIEHTEASYVVDGKGDVRALYLYPFKAADIAKTISAVAPR